MIFSETAATAWRSAGLVFNPVPKRIIRVRLKLHTGFVSLIAVYAQTNESINESEEKRVL